MQMLAHTTIPSYCRNGVNASSLVQALDSLTTDMADLIVQYVTILEMLPVVERFEHTEGLLAIMATNTDYLTDTVRGE